MITYALNDLVNVAVLQEIQERFAAAVGLGVIITKVSGEPITTPSKFTNFCAHMRASTAGLRCCVVSDETIGRKAAEQQRAIAQICHAGLLDFAAPIVLHGQHIGNVLCGQVFQAPPNKQQLQQLRAQCERLAIDPDLLARYWQEIESTNDRQVEATLHLLQLLADYIAKISASSLLEETLQQKAKEQQHAFQLLLQDMQAKLQHWPFNDQFLFNTLNTISRLAYLEQAEETETVTYALANMMRYSLRSTAEPVTLKEEWAYIESYLTIQQARFRHELTYELKLAIDPATIYIPIFSLQPLIENAVIHGLTPQTSDKKIICDVSKFERDVLVTLTDTGIGMSAETCAMIFSQLQNATQLIGSGLQQVERRLQHSFGKGYGIRHIKSDRSTGTTIQIVLPLLGGEGA